MALIKLEGNWGVPGLAQGLGGLDKVRRELGGARALGRAWVECLRFCRMKGFGVHQKT